MHRAVALLFVVVLLAGCGGSQASITSPPSSSPAVSPSASPSEAMSPQPSAVLEPTTAAGGTIPEGPIPPGEYTSTSLGETISFTVDAEGWMGSPDIPDVGLALTRQEIRGGVSITTFGGEVFAQPCSPDQTETIDATAAAFVAWLADHPELNATEPVETTLGGHPAVQLDVTSDVDPECPETPRIWLWVLPVVGDFHLNEDEAARFIVADVDDTPTVVVIESFDPARQADLLEAAQPILDSLTITP